MEIGRLVAKSGTPARELTVKHLDNLLAEFAQNRGSVRVAEAAGSKLTSESLLNVLQKLREKRRSLFTRLLFRAGYRFLSLFWGLAPLP